VQRIAQSWTTEGARFLAFDKLLDARATGPQWLTRPGIARAVIGALFGGQDKGFYELGSWVVMPNHVHALICPVGDLSKIVSGIKVTGAKEANRLLNRTGAFWSRDYFDRGSDPAGAHEIRPKSGALRVTSRTIRSKRDCAAMRARGRIRAPREMRLPAAFSSICNPTFPVAHPFQRIRRRMGFAERGAEGIWGIGQDRNGGSDAGASGLAQIYAAAGVYSFQSRSGVSCRASCRSDRCDFALHAPPSD
jgi:hypothetical protein